MGLGVERLGFGFWDQRIVDWDFHPVTDIRAVLGLGFGGHRCYS